MYLFVPDDTGVLRVPQGKEFPDTPLLHWKDGVLWKALHDDVKLKGLCYQG